MAQLPNQNEEELELGQGYVPLTSGAEETGSQAPQDTGNTFVRNLQQMLAASSGSASEFVQKLTQYYDTEAQRLAPMVSKMSPAEAQRYLQFFNMPFTQTGLEEWLQRTVGSSSQEGYSGGMARLDAFLAGQSGLGSLEDQQRKHAALLKSLGLQADPTAQLPPTQGGGGTVTQPPPPTQGGGAGYTPPGYTPPPNPWQGGGGGYTPPDPWSPGGGGYPYPDYSGGMPGGYTPPPAPSYGDYGGYTPSAGYTGGSGGSGGWTPQSDYDAALQRYQTWGIGALDEYEKGLLGLSGGYNYGGTSGSATGGSGGGYTSGGNYQSPQPQNYGDYQYYGDQSDLQRALDRLNQWGWDSLDQYERDLVSGNESFWSAGGSGSDNVGYTPAASTPQPTQTSGGGYDFGGSTMYAPVSDWQAALDRYNMWGWDSLDQYERDLLSGQYNQMNDGSGQNYADWQASGGTNYGGSGGGQAWSPQSDYDAAVARMNQWGWDSLDQYEKDLISGGGGGAGWSAPASSYPQPSQTNSGQLNFGGNVGPVAPVSDWQAALDRYNAWGWDALDDYEKSLLSADNYSY